MVFGLCPPMCGKAVPFRADFLKIVRGCASNGADGRHSLENLVQPNGKAQPFHTSSGTAAFVGFIFQTPKPLL